MLQYLLYNLNHLKLVQTGFISDSDPRPNSSVEWPTRTGRGRGTMAVPRIPDQIDNIISVK